jgi:5-methylcytosine-specific restriction endonuclease McrA
MRDPVCTQCGQTDAEKFNTRPPRKPGGERSYRSRCKDCLNADHNAYHAKRYAEDEEYRQRFSAHRKNSEDRALAEGRPTAIARKARRQARSSPYPRDNRAAINAHNRERYEHDPDFRAKVRQYHRTRRAREHDSPGYFTEDEWLSLLLEYGYRCALCGVACWNADLEPDHIIPLARGGENWITNIQPLCVSCNRSKQDG